jgi:hypothetical protein
MSERETVVERPWAADCCPCVEKLRTVLPLTVGIRDGAVQLVLTNQRARTLVVMNVRVPVAVRACGFDTSTGCAKRRVRPRTMA